RDGRREAVRIRHRRPRRAYLNAVTLLRNDADPGRVVVDLTGAHLWDASAVAALDAVEQRYLARGCTFEVVGLNPRSRALQARLGG
ncbi:MAG: STAS domain-containing protein, partial [Thermoleophilia bacterium]|nr:STAS domain-containing protein [Thermoleophilia bacterium]